MLDFEQNYTEYSILVFFKWANPGLFLLFFCLFKQTIQFLQHVNSVYGAGIRTHDFLNMSHLT